MKRAADDSRPAKKTPLPLLELRRRWHANAIRRFGTDLVDRLLELCRRAAAAIRAAWTTATPASDGPAAGVVDVDLAAVDVAATVYIHREHFRRRHLLAEARRHLARELRGRRAAPGLESRIVTAAIHGHCVDVTAPRLPGRRPRPPGHTVYTATWHPAPPPREDTAQGAQDTGMELSVHERAVATSIRLQAILRASRTPTPAAQPGRSARRGKPSPQDQETATVLYEQLAFDVAGDAGQDQEHGQNDNQERQFVISPERLAWLEDLKRRVGELARDAPQAKSSRKRRGGHWTAAAVARRAGHPPHYGRPRW